MPLLRCRTRVPLPLQWPDSSKGAKLFIAQKRSLLYFFPQDAKAYRPLIYMTSLVVQMVKNLPAMQETQVQSLGQEDPLEKGMSTYSSSLAWRIPWTEEPGSLQSTGSQRVRHDWATNTFTLVSLSKGLEWLFWNKAVCFKMGVCPYLHPKLVSDY